MVSQSIANCLWPSLSGILLLLEHDHPPVVTSAFVDTVPYPSFHIWDLLPPGSPLSESPSNSQVLVSSSIDFLRTPPAPPHWQRLAYPPVSVCSLRCWCIKYPDNSCSCLPDFPSLLPSFELYEFVLLSICGLSFFS